MAAGVAHLASQPGAPAVVFVYVEEAHAEDEWPIATPAQFSVATQHTVLADRLRAIERMRTALPPLAHFPIYADGLGPRHADRCLRAARGA